MSRLSPVHIVRFCQFFFGFLTEDSPDLAGRLRYLDLRGEGPLWGPVGEARHIATLGGLTQVGRRVRATFFQPYSSKFVCSFFPRAA